MTPERLRHPIARLVATATVASLAVLAACEAKLPTTDEIDRMTASSATSAAGRVTMLDTSVRQRPATSAASKPREFAGLMIVDGVITDPAIANSLPRDQIVSVNVIKGAAATSQYTDPRAVNGVIQIVTTRAKR